MNGGAILFILKEIGLNRANDCERFISNFVFLKRLNISSEDFEDESNVRI